MYPHMYEILFFFFLQHAYASDSDSENRHKRHKKDRDGSRRNGAHEELEDGELGEDGEIR